MSTPSTEPTPAPADQTATDVQTASTESTESTSEGTLGNVEEAEPGFVTRHTTTLITLMVAVIVAAVAIAGVVLYRHNVDRKNSDTEAAFTQNVAAQGATVETVECSGDTCAAVIQGQAYTVLVQKDPQGHQHFGISAFAGK